MLGLSATSHLPNTCPSIPKPLPSFLPLQDLTFRSQSLYKSKLRPIPRKLVLFAENGNRSGNSPATDDSEERERKVGEKNGDGRVDLKEEEEEKRREGGDGRPRFSLRWVELLVDPDPDNIVAVGLTGLLSWASVQVLWQLLLISVAILVAALKYSFIAAFLIIILVTLL